MFASNPEETPERVIVVALVTPAIVAFLVVSPDKYITSPTENVDTKSVPIPFTVEVDAALIVLPVIP